MKAEVQNIETKLWEMFCLSTTPSSPQTKRQSEAYLHYWVPSGIYKDQHNPVLYVCVRASVRTCVCLFEVFPLRVCTFTCTLSEFCSVLLPLTNPPGGLLYYTPSLFLMRACAHTHLNAFTNVLKHTQHGDSWVTDHPCSFVPHTPAQLTTSHSYVWTDTNIHTNTHW